MLVGMSATLDSFGDRSFEYQVSKIFLLCKVFRRVNVIAKSASCLSFCRHMPTRLPLKGFT